MSLLLHELPLHSARRSPDAVALEDRARRFSYVELCAGMRGFSNGLLAAGLSKGERVAVYLPKTAESVLAMFGTSVAGGVFVPVNSLLKPAQVGHILDDSGARVLVTATSRLDALLARPDTLANVSTIVLTDAADVQGQTQATVHRWAEFCAAPERSGHRVIDADMLALLYTSGSTGRPKGVVLSHRNMVTGAHSVADYLGNDASDRLLAVLPFSFDYGFSQLSTAFAVGASVVLMEYLLPRDVVRKIHKAGITGLAGVPPLWNQLAALAWPDGSADTLRYFTNSGGAMPKATLTRLRERMPTARPFLMYGLTEAFRSTYLPPDEVDRRPDSIGKAIPNAEILILNSEGRRCQPGETGELVHRGSLVSLGYWNNPEKTAERFKALPPDDAGLVLPEIAVWSGDSVRSDDEGYLYFVGRRDEMIKTSGYRVSPNEVEEVIYDCGVAAEAVALGVPHPDIGQAVLVIATAKPDQEADTDALLQACRDNLANFMLPRRVEWLDSLPRNPNGKIDRAGLAARYRDLFANGDPA